MELPVCTPFCEYEMFTDLPCQDVDVKLKLPDSCLTPFRRLGLLSNGYRPVTKGLG